MRGWEPAFGDPDPEKDELFGEPKAPRVVLRGMGWRLVANYLQELGGQMVEPEPGRRSGQARLEGKGWQATLHEYVEFTGALRSNRVEVRFSGESEAIEEVLDGLRRMALLEGTQ